MSEINQPASTNGYVPTTDEVRADYVDRIFEYVGVPEEQVGADFDTWLNSVRAAAWEKGHLHRQRRGPDDCHCYAYYPGECACGRFGTGELISLKDNPYKQGEEL